MNKWNAQVPMMANNQVPNAQVMGETSIMTYTIMQQSLGFGIIAICLSHEQVKCRGPNDGY
jgi:hypothetical protein